MRVIEKFVFLCLVLAPNIKAQFSPNLEEPEAYMTAVVDAFWTKIKHYGLSDLRVPDVSFVYNVTSFGVELIGPVSFQDGFVQDITSVFHTHFTSNIDTIRAGVSARVRFEGLRLYRDLRADLKSGLKLATCVITPDTFVYQLDIRKAHNNDTVVPQLGLYSAGSLVWEVEPDDLITRMIRRQSLIASSLSGNAVELVSTALDEWTPLFLKFIEEIVETMEFPALTF